MPKVMPWLTTTETLTSSCKKLAVMKVTSLLPKYLGETAIHWRECFIARRLKSFENTNPCFGMSISEIKLSRLSEKVRDVVKGFTVRSVNKFACAEKSGEQK